MNQTEDTVRTLLEPISLLDTVWGKRILAAAKREDEGEPGLFTVLDRSESSNWIDCACGQVGKVRPFEVYTPNDKAKDVPVDKELQNFGRIFSENIEEHDPVQAARTLISIETRAHQLEIDEERDEN